MPLRLREKLRLFRLLYIGLALGFVLGAAMMASPALAVVVGLFLLLDLFRRVL